MSEPDFAYRTFYTWDHSTNWDLNQPGIRVYGCHEPYGKPPRAFIEDYTRLMDYMESLGLNHLIVWGALRDTHGGVRSLRRLIEYGLARGVRVAPGVGVNCYGGVYYEGDHEFSLVALLRKRPDLAAVDKSGKPMLGGKNPRVSVACPRNEEVREWTLRSIRWLMEEVDPPAIHFETGDYGVCHCGPCAASSDRSLYTSDDDIAEVLPPLVKEARSSGKDVWLSYNHYHGYTRAMMESKPRFAAAIPPDVICKWGVSWMLAPEFSPPPDDPWHCVPIEPMDPALRPPTATSMAHFHFGTGWWNCSPRGTLEIGRIMRAVPLIKRSAFQGICTHGEESALNPPCEMNYRVYAALAERADASPQKIAAMGLGKLYGSEALMAEVLGAFKTNNVPPRLTGAVARAAAKARGQTRVRLNWLTFELHRLAERARSG